MHQARATTEQAIRRADEAKRRADEAKGRADIATQLAKRLEDMLVKAQLEHLQAVGKLHLRGVMEMYEKQLGKTPTETRTKFWQRKLKEEERLFKKFGECVGGRPTNELVAQYLVKLYADASSAIHNHETLVVLIYKGTGPNWCLAKSICEECKLTYKIVPSPTEAKGVEKVEEPVEGVEEPVEGGEGNKQTVERAERQ